MYSLFSRFKDYLTLREAVRTADSMHARTRERYYVIPSTAGKLLVMDRRNFRALKRKHYISDKVSIYQLEKECFYFTPYRNDSGSIPPGVETLKRRQYFAFCKGIRRIRRQQRLAGIRHFFKKLFIKTK